MNLLVTEVTEMHGGNFCVATWNPAARRMVRPLPNGANWTQGLLRPHGVTPGATISVVPTGRQAIAAYPHLTEDMIIDSQRIALVTPGPVDWFAPAAPPVSRSISQAFSGMVAHNSVWDDMRQGVHLPAGSQCCSLAAVAVPRANLDFIEEFEKLKATLFDGQYSYKLSVSSLALKDAWRQGGINAVKAAVPRSARLHVRLGLARPFGNPPDKCYMMINGVYG